MSHQMSHRATIRIVLSFVDCQRTGPCTENQGCIFGTRFECLFFVLQRSAAPFRRTSSSVP